MPCVGGLMTLEGEQAELFIYDNEIRYPAEIVVVGTTDRRQLSLYGQLRLS